MSLLTEQEITEIVREAARGSATRRDGSTSQRIARAIESAVIEKIKAHGPDMLYHGRCVIDCGEYGHADVELLKLIPAGTKLYRLPEGRLRNEHRRPLYSRI